MTEARLGLQAMVVTAATGSTTQEKQKETP